MQHPTTRIRVNIGASGQAFLVHFHGRQSQGDSEASCSLIGNEERWTGDVMVFTWPILYEASGATTCRGNGRFRRHLSPWRRLITMMMCLTIGLSTLGQACAQQPSPAPNPSTTPNPEVEQLLIDAQSPDESVWKPAIAQLQTMDGIALPVLLAISKIKDPKLRPRLRRNLMMMTDIDSDEFKQIIEQEPKKWIRTSALAVLRDRRQINKDLLPVVRKVLLTSPRYKNRDLAAQILGKNAGRVETKAVIVDLQKTVADLTQSVEDLADGDQKIHAEALAALHSAQAAITQLDPFLLSSQTIPDIERLLKEAQHPEEDIWYPAVEVLRRKEGVVREIYLASDEVDDSDIRARLRRILTVTEVDDTKQFKEIIERDPKPWLRTAALQTLKTRRDVDRELIPLVRNVLLTDAKYRNRALAADILAKQIKRTDREPVVDDLKKSIVDLEQTMNDLGEEDEAVRKQVQAAIVSAEAAIDRLDPKMSRAQIACGWLGFIGSVIAVALLIREKPTPTAAAAQSHAAAA